MQLLRSNIIGFGFLLIMLFSLSGISLHRMTCTLSGATELSIGVADDDCCEPQPSNSIGEDCCEESSAFIQVHDFDRLVQQTIAVVPVELHRMGFVAHHDLLTQVDFFGANKAPPSVSAVDLTRIEVFRL